jgi:hypothetical protein
MASAPASLAFNAGRHVHILDVELLMATGVMPGEQSGLQVGAAELSMLVSRLRMATFETPRDVSSTIIGA